ncbi:MAG TPA: mannitol dehydrogenase family protein [Aestuariivirga sp.]
MTKRVVQFGTSRFLQAHADLFIHEARIAGQDIGPITVVKTTRGTERSGRVSAFGDKAGYPVIIRGIIDNKTVNNTLTVKSIDGGLIADRDWQKLNEVFANDAEVVISNVGESGYAVAAEDEMSAPSDNQVPASFPAKLLSLLRARYLAGGKPLLILPCELISENGKVLRQILVALADKWKLDSRFNTWISTKVTLCDTLVDRIVSEAIEPVGAIAEPYALWAIKREVTYKIPFTHPAIVETDDLEPFLRLKLHILNLGHSFLAEIWRSQKRPPDETVREILSDPAIKKRLTDLYREEVIPGFAGYGMAEAATTYVAATLERFENPFLNHRLSDIAQNHRLKLDRRVVDFITWIKKPNPSANVKMLQALSA